MAFPFLFEENFETGTLGAFNTETDTESRLDFPHYSDLAKIPAGSAPYRGAYCMRVNLANDGSPADALVQETDGFDTAAAGVIHVKFCFYVSPDITMANTDEFAIFQMWSATNTVEGGAYINFTTANGLRLGIGETSATVLKPLTTGEWHQLEMIFDVDNAGANDGTIDAWLDGSAYTQVATLDQGAITSAVLGVMSQDAGTTRGFILYDQVYADDARLGPFAQRWPRQLVLTKSGHVFVGAGIVEDVSLLSGAATDNVLRLYDTDIGSTTDVESFVTELKNTSNGQLVNPEDKCLRFNRGCYVSMTGTNPRAVVKILRAPGYFSEGTIRGLGQQRRAHPLGL